MRLFKPCITLPLWVLLLALLTSCSSEDQAADTAWDHEQSPEVLAQPDLQVTQQKPEPALVTVATTEPPKPVLTDKELDALKSELAANLQTLEQETASVSTLFDNRQLDYNLIIQEAGSTPQDLYQWVKTNTRPLPYRGVLKGAWGVLIERQGNSIDRSLLLVELLHRAGYQAELSNATLNQQALFIAKDIVLAGLDEAPAEDTTSDSGWNKEDLAVHQATLAGLTGTSPEAAQQEAEQEAIKSITEIAELIFEAHQQTEVLVNKLPIDDYSATPLLNDALASLEDHWWVELTVDGETEAFDFFFDQGENSLAELGYANGDSIVLSREDLLEDQYHHITFRIIADQMDAREEIQSRTVLTHTLRTSESRLVPIKLSFFALNNKLKDLSNNAVNPISSAEWSRKKLHYQTEWLPALTIDGDVYSEAVIRADGSLELEPNLSLSDLERRLRETFKPVQGNDLAAVRLEIDIAGGGIDNTMSRTLYDYRDHLAAAIARNEMRQKEFDDAATAAAIAATAAADTADVISSKVKELQADLVAKEKICSEESGIALERVRIVRDPSAAYGDTELYTSLVVWEHCFAVMMDYSYAQDVPLEKQAEAALSMTGDKLQADLNNRRQECSKQSGFDLEDLRVLEKDADRTTWQNENLFAEITESEICMDLAKRLNFPADYMESSRNTVQTLTTPPSPRPPENPLQSEELLVARAAKFMMEQRFLVLPFNVTEEYVSAQIYSSTVNYQKALRKLMNDKQPFSPEQLVMELKNHDAAALKLLSFARLRQQPDTVGAFAITQANLVSEFRMISFSRTAADLSDGVDIVANNILPLSTNAEVGRQTAIRQGVFDTLVENHLVESGQDSVNTASQFQSDLEKDKAIEWVATQANTEPGAFPGIAINSDPETFPVLVYSPSRFALQPSSAGFWLVDIKTGQTLGYTYHGRGGAIEMIISIGAALKRAKTMLAFAKCFNTVAKDRCKVGGCIAKAMGHFLKKGVGGVFGAVIPNSSFKLIPGKGIKNFLDIFSLPSASARNLILQQMGLKIIDKKVKGKALAGIVKITNDLAESNDRIMCSLGEAVPSIRSVSADGS